MGHQASAVSDRGYLQAASLGAERLATAESAAYCYDRMPNAALARDRFSLLSSAVDWCGAHGLVLEFAETGGRTIRHLAELLPHRQVFGFSSGENKVPSWRPTGRRDQPAPPPQANIMFIGGYYGDTVARCLAHQTDAVDLLHLCTDTRETTYLVLSQLASRIGVGSVIVFDQYFNHPMWRQHAFRAFQDFVGANDLTYEYLGFVPTDQQVCVRITG